MTTRLRFRHGITTDGPERAQRVEDARPLDRKVELSQQLRAAQEELNTLKGQALRHPGWYDEPIKRAQQQVDALER